MSRNIEIKARIDNLSLVYEKTATLADAGPTEIAQEDVFFNCGNGRLKLRIFDDGSGELIFYRRPDQAGPKESFYLRSPTAAPASLCEALSQAHGVAGRVKKIRTLFLAGRTRVHLDRVEGLGEFVELEVVLEDAEPPDAGIREAQVLMQHLGIAADRLIDGAYVDMLQPVPPPHPRVSARGETSD